MKTDEQKLVDIMFEIAFTSAKYMHDRSHEEIAEWVRQNLADCGFPTTPIGSCWGTLDKRA